MYIHTKNPNCHIMYIISKITKYIQNYLQQQKGILVHVSYPLLFQLLVVFLYLHRLQQGNHHIFLQETSGNDQDLTVLCASLDDNYIAWCLVQFQLLACILKPMIKQTVLKKQTVVFDIAYGHQKNKIRSKTNQSQQILLFVLCDYVISII